MKYCEFIITDNGYACNKASDPWLSPVEIWGLDNRDDQAFEHNGYTYPDLTGVDVLFQTEAGPHIGDRTMLIAYDGDELSQGDTVAAETVLTKLIAEYGWPENSEMVDGLPVCGDIE